MNNDCTLLLNSYDGGEDLWDGFFKALSIQWPEMDMKVVLNTEKKHYSYPGYDIQTFEPCKNKNMTWAQRLITVLKKIDTNYVLFFLDDYWLDNRVDYNYFNKTLEWMKRHPEIANFSYYPCLPETNIDDKRFEKFERRPQKCQYKFNCQVGLWRTKELISFLRLHENPWEWEMFGSIRAGRCEQLFYSLKKNEQLIFSYGDLEIMGVIYRGKWVEKNVIPLAEKYNLTIDYSKRGFYNPKVREEWRNLSTIQRAIYGNVFKLAWNKLYTRYRKYLSIRKIKGEL